MIDSLCGIARVSTLIATLLPCALVAQSSLPPRQPIPQPFAEVRVTGTALRAPTAERARFLPVTGRPPATWGLRVDSAPGAVLHATMSLYSPAGANALAIFRIPVAQGVLGTPTVSTTPRAISPMSRVGRDGAVLPPEQAELVAIHAQMRQILETGALFESEPPNGRSVRRTQYSSGRGDIALAMTVVRVSRTLRDTVVNGRRALMVRDSTAVQLDHAVRQPSSYHNTFSRERERAGGSIVGLRLVDVQTHRAFDLHDTLTMQGTLNVDDGLGGVFESPLYIRSVRHAVFHDAFWRATIPREPFDMVRYSSESRLPVLSSAARDSLLRQLERAPLVGTRDSLRARLLVPEGPSMMLDTSVWRAVRTRSLAVGDTASIIARLMEGLQYRDLVLEVGDYRLLRAPLANAATAFALGVKREELALTIMDLLMQRPPAVAAFRTRPACSPSACAAMRADARSGVPGLQAVALVAGMVTQPRLWTDSVLRYAERNPFLATRAKWFAQGTATTAVAGAKAPIPSADAPYEAWRHWLTGRDSSYEQALRADTAMLRIRQRMPVRQTLEASPIAAAAVHFTQARTGVDYVAAFRQHRDTTQQEAARALFNALLIAMHERVYSDADLARLLLRPGGPERDVAAAQWRAMVANTRGTLPVVSDSLATVIGRHVVNMVFADSVLARSDTTPQRGNWYRVPTVVDSLPRYVVMDAYPDAVRARATALGFSPVARGWRLREGDAGHLIQFDPIVQLSGLVQVNVSYTTLYARGAGRSGGYAGGFTLTLLDGPNGWTIVDAQAWVT